VVHTTKYKAFLFTENKRLTQSWVRSGLLQKWRRRNFSLVEINEFFPPEDEDSKKINVPEKSEGGERYSETLVSF